MFQKKYKMFSGEVVHQSIKKLKKTLVDNIKFEFEVKTTLRKFKKRISETHVLPIKKPYFTKRNTDKKPQI